MIKKNLFKVPVLASIVMSSFFYSGSVTADSSVWKAEKDGKHIFLGGTIHLLSKEDYPLPKEYEQAYKKSDAVFFEVDMKKLKDPEIAQSLMSVLMAKEGETLDKVLEPETMKALTAYMEQKGLPMSMINSLTPGGASLMLTMMELSALGMTDAGVDEFYDTKARQDKKSLGQMETVEEQLSFLSSIGKGDPDQFIMYTLRDLTEMPKLMADMQKAWRTGDRKQYRELMLAPFMKDYPKIYEDLLVTRNSNWMPKIEALFDTPEVELVLVGALHMVGKDGLLQQLEAKGYSVEPFEGKE